MQAEGLDGQPPGPSSLWRTHRLLVRWVLTLGTRVAKIVLMATHTLPSLPPPSERSGVRPIRVACEPTLDEIDAAWEAILDSSKVASLGEMASSLFAAVEEHGALAAELTALIAKIRTVKAKELALRNRVWARMNSEEARRVRCDRGTVVFVADRTTERGGRLEIISGSGLRLIVASNGGSHA